MQLEKHIDKAKEIHNEIREHLDSIHEDLHAGIQEHIESFHAEMQEQLDAQIKAVHEAFPSRQYENQKAMSAEQFAKAKSIYKETLNDLEQIEFVIHQIYQIPISTDTFKRDFDIMLQTILLRTAAGDSDFSRSERHFIEGLVENGDAVSWVNSTFTDKKQDLTWGKLYYLEEDELNGLIDYITKTGKKLMTKAFLPIVAADALTEVNYQNLILKNIKEICRLFAFVDGDGQNEKEKAAMERAIDIYFEFPIVKAQYEFKTKAKKFGYVLQDKDET